MANEEHLAVVTAGAASIAKCRRKYPGRWLDLRNAALKRVYLRSANLSGAYLNGASLNGASLNGANLNGANLNGANLNGANLMRANLNGANLSDANLSGVGLHESNLDYANLSGADLSGVSVFDCRFANVRLSAAVGLALVLSRGPSTIGTDTLKILKGNVTPEIEAFLRNCGLEPWEIEFARLYNPDLTGPEVAELGNRSRPGPETDLAL